MNHKNHFWLKNTEKNEFLKFSLEPVFFTKYRKIKGWVNQIRNKGREGKIDLGEEGEGLERFIKTKNTHDVYTKID